MNSCAIVIPVYNEEDAIGSTVERLQKIISQIQNWKFEIVCVNDGSSDRTGDVLNQIGGITLLTHQINRGYGAALKTGLSHVSTRWVFICDADATYPIEDLPNLLSEAEKGFDMVIGARRGIGISERPFHRMARWTLRKMTHILTGTMVPDLNSGMRVFRRKLFLEFRNLLPMGFSFTTTITMASLYSGYQLKYLPINYSTRIGKSNIKPVKDFFGFSVLILRIASYFEPLRFFLPVALTVMFLGIAKGARDFVVLGTIGALAVTMFILGVQIFMAGLTAEVIVRRSAPLAVDEKDDAQ